MVTQFFLNIYRFIVISRPPSFIPSPLQACCHHRDVPSLLCLGLCLLGSVLSQGEREGDREDLVVTCPDSQEEAKLFRKQKGQNRSPSFLELGPQMLLEVILPTPPTMLCPSLRDWSGFPLAFNSASFYWYHQFSACALSAGCLVPSCLSHTPYFFSSLIGIVLPPVTCLWNRGWRTFPRLLFLYNSCACFKTLITCHSPQEGFLTPA